MRLASIIQHSVETAGLMTQHGCLPIKNINEIDQTSFATDILELITLNQLPNLKNWLDTNLKIIKKKFAQFIIPANEIHYAPLYRHPKKIWGIGLNYREHAADLSEKAPQGIPASFMKASTTIIGHGETIQIPLISERTTGEAELAMVVGKKCKNVPRKNWLDVVAGFVPILDMTAEDILRKNPRYLTVCKNFDSFLVFGQQLITPDEITNVSQLKVATVLNNEIVAQNYVSNMTFPPDFLIEFHSKVMTLLPGDIILTGTPKAAVLHDEDILECRIEGFPAVKNPVQDMKIPK